MKTAASIDPRAECVSRDSFIGPGILLHSHTQTPPPPHTHTLYRFNVTYIAGAAVQSNLELSLSNTSRVLGRCLRSGFTSFLRWTADITGGKRRMRYRGAHREAQIENTGCLYGTLAFDFVGTRVAEPSRLIILRNCAHFADAY